MIAIISFSVRPCSTYICVNLGLRRSHDSGDAHALIEASGLLLAVLLDAALEANDAAGLMPLKRVNSSPWRDTSLV